MIALLALVLALTASDARQVARDAAPELAGVSGRVTVGHCVLHGRFARCPVRVRSDRERCRLVVHMRKRGIHYDVTGSRVECWQ